MHIGVDSMVTIRQGEPWGGESGIVEDIRVYTDAGPAPVVYLTVALESGRMIPFDINQVERHQPRFTRDGVSARLGLSVTAPLQAAP